MASQGTMSNYLVHMLLNASFRDPSNAWTTPTNVYLGFSTSNITNGSTGASPSEPNGTWTSYTRTTVTSAHMNAAGSRAKQNGSVITVDAGATCSSPVNLIDWFIADSVTVGAGNILWYGTLDGTQTVQNGNPVTIPAGSLKVAVSSTENTPS